MAESTAGCTGVGDGVTTSGLVMPSVGSWRTTTFLSSLSVLPFSREVAIDMIDRFTASWARLFSCLAASSDAKLMLSEAMVGGVELKDAPFEKVSAAPVLKLDSEDNARVGDKVGSECIDSIVDRGL